MAIKLFLVMNFIILVYLTVRFRIRPEDYNNLTFDKRNVKFEIFITLLLATILYGAVMVMLLIFI